MTVPNQKINAKGEDLCHVESVLGECFMMRASLIGASPLFQNLMLASHPIDFDASDTFATSISFDKVLVVFFA